MKFLSFFDFMTNSVMMPLAAICILVLRCVGVSRIEEEVFSSSAFRRRGMYRFILRYIALFLLSVILISSVLDAFGVIRI